MNTYEAERYRRWNEKYAGRFILTRWSSAELRSIQVGKPCATIQDAMAKAKRLERKNNAPMFTYMIDVTA